MLLLSKDRLYEKGKSLSEDLRRLIVSELEGIDYAREVLNNFDTIEFLRFFGQAQRFSTLFGRRTYSVDDHILHNASIHSFEGGDALVHWLTNRNCWLVYTPVYSPEVNAAELVFKYLETILKFSPYRQLARQNLPATVSAILSGITPQLMFEFFKELSIFQNLF